MAEWEAPRAGSAVAKTPDGAVAPKFRLAIEALGVKHGGGATVLRDLVDAAAEDSRVERIFVFCSPRGLRQFSFSDSCRIVPDSSRIVEVEPPFAEGNRLYRLWWLERQLPGELRRLGCDVLLCLSGCGRGSAAIPHVTMIQQSLPFSAEAIRLAGPIERLRLRALRGAMRRSCMSSRRVIVQTHTMRRVVSGAFSLPLERIGVVAPCVREMRAGETPSPALAAMRSAPRGLRVLYVGNQSAYKNVGLLLQAAEQLRRRIPHLSVFLTWPPHDRANRRPGVVCLGYLGDTELAEALSLADVFVMPSLQETVGLPLLEAMSAGTPIAAADRPYAREVCGNAAAFFDPLKASDLANSMELVLSDVELRERLIAEGRRISEARRLGKPYEHLVDELAQVAEGVRQKASPR